MTELNQLLDEVVGKLRTLSPDARAMALAIIERDLRTAAPTAAPVKRHGGRPLGSKNKPKVAAAPVAGANGPNGADLSATVTPTSSGVVPLAVN